MKDEVKCKNRSIASAFRGYAAIACIAGAYAYMPTASAATCEHTIQSEWGDGFIASIKVINDGSELIDSWDITWEYDDAAILSSWNADISGSNPYAATDVGWNQYIYPGETAEVGIHGSKNTPFAPAPNPVIQGVVCGFPDPTPIITPTPSPSPSPDPYLCGDSWPTLEIRGLDGDDTIELSWYAGWGGGLNRAMGNGVTNHHFSYCTSGPFPPAEFILVDTTGYSCVVGGAIFANISVECTAL